MVKVRKAERNELSWVNERYREIGFMTSDFEGELIAVAEVEGQKAGVGRLVVVDEATLELGGMYVLPEFRKHGVARGIVTFLLEQREPGKRVFCLPFAHLSKFYESFGFRPHEGKVPEELMKKQRWCDQTYPQKTLIYELVTS